MISDQVPTPVRPLLCFFAIAYAMSWLFWLPAAAAGLGWIGPVPSRISHLAGGLGPMSSAIVTTIAWSDKAALKRLLQRSVLGGRWVAISVLIPALLFLVSAAVVAGLQGEAIQWSAVGASTEFPDWPRSLYWVANIVCYGYGEEMGWRGFALPRLQATMSALHASLVVTRRWQWMMQASSHRPLRTWSIRE